MKDEDKTPVSQFEYAISEAVGDQKFMDTHRPATQEEVTEERRKKIESFFRRIRVKHD